MSSLAGLTMIAISPATSPSPPSAGRNLAPAGRAIAAAVMSSVVVVMSWSSSFVCRSRWSRCRARSGPRLCGLVGRPEAEQTAERGAEREPEPLQPGRRERQPDVAEVVARDDREPERVRHALAVHLAVVGEREHRLDELLEAEGGPHLADEVGGLLADVAEAVRRPGRDDDAVARLRDDRLLAEPELELAREHLEALLLCGMDVRRRDGAVRLDERLDDDRLAVRLGRGLAEHERLAGDGIRDGLSGGDHVCLLGAGLDGT